jgi:hypothetical protein
LAFLLAFPFLEIAFGEIRLLLVVLFVWTRIEVLAPSKRRRFKGISFYQAFLLAFPFLEIDGEIRLLNLFGQLH